MRETSSGREWRDVGDVTLHDPLEAVADTDDVDAFQNSADRGGRYDTVDPGGGTSADEDGEMLMLTHGAILTLSLRRRVA